MTRPPRNQRNNAKSRQGDVRKTPIPHQAANGTDRGPSLCVAGIIGLLVSGLPELAYPDRISFTLAIEGSPSLVQVRADRG